MAVFFIPGQGTTAQLQAWFCRSEAAAYCLDLRSVYKPLTLQTAGWQVKGERNSRATARTQTQTEAIKIARSISRNQESELVIHRPNGEICDKDFRGHDPFPPRGQLRWNLSAIDSVP